jgi:hypothetical protein
MGVSYVFEVLRLERVRGIEPLWVHVGNVLPYQSASPAHFPLMCAIRMTVRTDEFTRSTTRAADGNRTREILLGKEMPCHWATAA